MNIHAAAAYAAHLLTARSTAGHGVHSPLMFSFITEVIGGRTDKHIIEVVRRLRREMLSDRRVVRVTDLGAGSTVMQGTDRRISRIAAVAALPARETALLARIAASLDAILGRVPGQQAGGSRADKQPTGDSQAPGRIAGDLQTPGRMAGDIPETGWTVKDLPVPDYPAGDPQMSYQPGDPRQESLPQITSQPIDNRRVNNLHADLGQEAGSPAQGAGGRDSNQIMKSFLADPYRPGSESNFPVILELGTSLGISTLALALGAPHRRVITIEGCPELAALARENLRRHGADNAEVLNMEFSQALSHLKDQGIKVGMAFIDGNHRGAALIDYTHRIMEMGDEIIIVADDIHLNIDMIHAWKSLCNGQYTTRQNGCTGEHIGQRQTSLETFRLGMLFCLQNLTPGLYRIRY